MKKQIAIIFIFISVGVCIFSCSSNGNHQAESAADISPLPEDTETFRDMSVFHLPAKWQTQEGDHITLSEFKGSVLVTVMIYTACKAACPRLVADMKDIQKKISDDTSIPVKYLLISIDPETDTAERLKEFSIENDMAQSQWIFLRSTEENTREFANVLAVRYAEISPIDFSHSNIISVFDKDGVMQHQMEGLAVNNEETVSVIKRLAGNIN
ncbi:MAG: SCO family protein [Bacteroidetes bacterium]|nr:SCO family protein [Bacteroidota bacterium]